VHHQHGPGTAPLQPVLDRSPGQVRDLGGAFNPGRRAYRHAQTVRDPGA